MKFLRSGGHIHESNQAAHCGQGGHIHPYPQHRFPESLQHGPSGPGAGRSDRAGQQDHSGLLRRHRHRHRQAGSAGAAERAADEASRRRRGAVPDDAHLRQAVLRIQPHGGADPADWGRRGRSPARRTPDRHL